MWSYVPESGILTPPVRTARLGNRAGRWRTLPSSLSEVGFIHLSTPEQVHLPANRLYSGRTDLVLLHIDPQQLLAPLRWEHGVPTDPESMRFPHLYGRLPTTAVMKVTAYQPGPDGRFQPLESPT